jgi:hypothetical protein
MDATLLPGWEALCQLLAPAFTGPTGETFLHIVTGWVLCRSKPVVTNLVCTIGRSLLGHAAKHWTVYERFFYRAPWSLPEVSRLLLVRVIAPLVASFSIEQVIDLNIDDTTCGRSGRHVAFAGYFKDASVSNTLKTVIHWSHNWVIGCVTMRPKRWPNWVIGLPALFTLYRKRPDCNRSRPFKTRQEIAGQMIRQVHEALPDWTIRVAADGQYATRTVVQAATGAGSYLVSRIRSDIGRFAARWPIEESIHDAKQLGGFEQVQGWCPRTVERQAPLAMIVQTLVKAWYLRYGVKAKSAQRISTCSPRCERLCRSAE